MTFLKFVGILISLGLLTGCPQIINSAGATAAGELVRETFDAPTRD